MERLVFMQRQHRFALVIGIVVIGTAFTIAAASKNRNVEPYKNAEARFASINSASTDCETFLPYSSDPNDIWNQVQRALLVRTARDGSMWGCDEVDPLLWAGTVHVLAGDKYKQTMRLLDEFIATHAEERIDDPLKHALFQRNLWGFFNWLVPYSWPGMTQKERKRIHFAERQELARRVATIIKAVALSAEEIRRLPDNYAALRGTITADGLELPDGSGWTLISRDDGLPAATDHTAFFPAQHSWFI